MPKYIVNEIGKSKINAVQGVGLIPEGALEIPSDFNENLLTSSSSSYINSLVSNYALPRSVWVAASGDHGAFSFNYVDSANVERTPYETPIPGIYGQTQSGESAVRIPLFDFRDIPLPDTGKGSPKLFRGTTDSTLTLTSLDAVLYENRGFSSFSSDYTMTGKMTRNEVPSSLAEALPGQRSSYVIGSVPYNYLSLLSFANSYAGKVALTPALADQYDAVYNYFGAIAAGTTSKVSLSKGYLIDGSSYVALSSFNVYGVASGLSAYVSIRGMEIPMKCTAVAKATASTYDYVVSLPRYLLDAYTDIMSSIDYIRISDTTKAYVYYSDSKLFASATEIYANDGTQSSTNYSDGAATLNVAG